ncbi:MAG: hypothetical protein JWN86_1107 [Planctomycetota bacterium]|nr:hypothetical protein [Planctomycetota bacterium]
MKVAPCLSFIMLVHAQIAFGQASGNIGYSQAGGRARAEQFERNKRTLVPAEMPPTGTTMFVDASVLMNVRADEFVAIFGVAQDGTTVAECNQKMDATIEEFTAALKAMGIGGADVDVDFAAQNKIYGFQVVGDLAKESLVGFELKKNIAIHYKDKRLLDKLVITASRSRIYDLIKVDYLVNDIEAVQDKLMEEAARIIKKKAARNEKLLGITLRPIPQVFAEKTSVYSPTEMYDSYVAQETEDIDRDQYRSKHIVQGARKGRTFFFNPLKADGFDAVIHPVVVEPVVQFTLYLKLKYEIDPKRGKGNE